ncbi:3-oxoacyl-[acyl-carrier-protein] reductase [Elysia marginata]|uniref:3-oxoacyl-[acyl-carrier-protein] reductase n=1 Tax=Elysia marginata TaxID=1093978 RepID=A0AAV4EKX0_9GAST|nr:3-oxoacyl-[acyl-carrier-protein] reductase [Elysia marginata]
MDLLKGKTVIVTGGTRGIGKGICKTLLKEGVNIAFTYNSSENIAKDLEREWTTDISKVKAYRSDASDFEQAQSLASQVVEDFGSIDVLVNNAGIIKDNLLMRMSERDFNDVININLKSVFNMTKAVQMTMLKQRKGSIIHMSSVVGLGGGAGQTNYAASKAGIIGFSRSLALELGSRNIRSNVIAPGFIETEMTDKLEDKVKTKWLEDIPLKRAGTPEDIGNVCLFLASDMSSYITGQTIIVDGGML